MGIIGRNTKKQVKKRRKKVPDQSLEGQTNQASKPHGIEHRKNLEDSKAHLLTYHG